MPKFPLHRIVQVADNGIQVRKITSSHLPELVRYAHRDDYYMFGVINKGKCRISVDFQEHCLECGETIFVQPGQVHYFVEAYDLEALVLIADSVLVNDMTRQLFEEYSLSPVPIELSVRQHREIQQILYMLYGRMNDDGAVGCGKELINSLSRAVICIVSEAVSASEVLPSGIGRRRMELMLEFRNLLKENIHKDRKPSSYASRLHISTVYLNEIVNSITGTSASRYIRNELVLQAKRLLVYSDGSISEIADRLGVSDYGYFTRVFTKATGESPSAFRKRILE